MRRLIFFLILLVVPFSAGCKSGPPANAPEAGTPPASAVSSADDAAGGTPVVVALGDSLTAGIRVDPALNYPAQLQAKIDDAGYRYRVVNAGVSGDTSAQGLNRLDSVRRLRPAVVIVELGANDGLRGIPTSETKKNLAEIISTLSGDGAKIVLAGMEVPPNYGPEYTKQFRAVFTDLARQYGTALVPFFLQGVGGIPELNQDDGIHPTAQGYRIVTENVWKVLEPILQKQRSRR